MRAFANFFRRILESLDMMANSKPKSDAAADITQYSAPARSAMHLVATEVFKKETWKDVILSGELYNGELEKKLTLATEDRIPFRPNAPFFKDKGLFVAKTCLNCKFCKIIDCYDAGPELWCCPTEEMVKEARPELVLERKYNEWVEARTQQPNGVYCDRFKFRDEGT